VPWEKAFAGYPPRAVCRNLHAVAASLSNAVLGTENLGAKWAQTPGFGGENRGMPGE